MEELKNKPAAWRNRKMHVLYGLGLEKGVQKTQAMWWIHLQFYRKNPVYSIGIWGICFNNILSESLLSGNRISFHFYEVKNEK